VVTGDGDALAIGGNHFIHMLRRNMDLNVLLFNNEIYGLTKGQSSPTSVVGQVTKSTPLGVIDRPFSAGELAMGAGTTFFARTIDTNPKLMKQIFIDSTEHKGTSLIEILQNCVIFNDKAFAPVTDRETQDDHQLHLEHGKPMIFGKEKNKGIRLNGLKLEVVTIGESGITEDDILVHDAHEPDPTLHNLLIRMRLPEFPVALGIIRQVEAPTYDDLVTAQKAQAVEKSRLFSMEDLINSGHTWEIEEQTT
jgi:2-oxoglutarate ferredoxin oxidoreductase subunit beta